jgi:hypothetical protein
MFARSARQVEQQACVHRLAMPEEGAFGYSTGPLRGWNVCWHHSFRRIPDLAVDEVGRNPAQQRQQV